MPFHGAVDSNMMSQTTFLPLKFGRNVVFDGFIGRNVICDRPLWQKRRLRRGAVAEALFSAGCCGRGVARGEMGQERRS